MSTRSQLRFVHRNESAAEQDSTNRIAQVYRHSDGYPESVLRDLAQLKHLLEKTRTERGPSYAAAQFIFITGSVVLLVENLLKTPLLLSQVTLLGLAGIFDIVAAIDTQLTARWAWYQWSGLGNICLGLSLPLGFVGSKNSLFFVLVAVIGGLSLAAMGIDMLVYHGKYTRGERLGQNGT